MCETELLRHGPSQLATRSSHTARYLNVALWLHGVGFDVAEWGDHPTFRVRNKNFLFSDDRAESLSVKLDKEEAAAVVATDDDVEPAGYGLARHGWVSIAVSKDADAARWEVLREWARSSYILVAPKKLAQVVHDEDAG